MHLYVAGAINIVKLGSFKNWFVTWNECKIYGKMKKNGDFQNIPITLKSLNNV